MDLTLDTKSSEWCAQHDKSIMSSDYIKLLSKQEKKKKKSMSLIKKRGHSEILFYCPDRVCSFSVFWRIVNKEVLQSISRPPQRLKLSAQQETCQTNTNTSGVKQAAFKWSQPRHRSPVFFVSYWVKWGQWSRRVQIGSMLWETGPTVLLVAICGGSGKCVRV